MSADAAQLQAEIIRLNVIINALVEKNLLLEQVLGQYRQEKAAVTPNIIPAAAPLSSHLSGFAPEVAEGRTQHDVFNPVTNKGRTETEVEIGKLFQEGIKVEAPTPFQFLGRLNPFLLYPTLNEGRLETSEEGGSRMPTRIELLQLAQVLTEDSIYNTLNGSGMQRVTNDGVLRMARMLLLLCQYERLSYAAIRKEVKMTDSGNYKLVAAMKRRGMIERKAYQHYILTTKALNLLAIAKKVVLTKRAIV